jgi:hypothetical protein
MLFVPDVDEGFFVFTDNGPWTTDHGRILWSVVHRHGQIRKEARMKNIKIFWKQGPLLAGLLLSTLLEIGWSQFSGT